MAVTEEALWELGWTFGDRLRKARRVTGKSQQEIADLLNVKVGRYSAWEVDAARPRDVVAVARQIEAGTGIPADWLLGIRTGSRWGGDLPPLHLLRAEDAFDSIPSLVDDMRYGYAPVETG